MKIMVRKKKNLKRLIKEDLEVHKVPDDLDEATPEEAYGDGYDAGREYSSEEDECGFDSKKIKITVGKREIIAEDTDALTNPNRPAHKRAQIEKQRKAKEIHRALDRLPKRPSGPWPTPPRHFKASELGGSNKEAADSFMRAIQKAQARADRGEPWLPDWSKGPPPASKSSFVDPHNPLDPTDPARRNIRQGPPPERAARGPRGAHKPSKPLSPSAWADAGFSNKKIDSANPNNWYRSTGKTPGPANIGQQALRGAGRRALGKQIAQAAVKDLKLAGALALMAVIFDTSSRGVAKVVGGFRKMNRDGGPQTKREQQAYDEAESHIKSEIENVNQQLNLEIDPKYYDKSIKTPWSDWADMVDLGYGDRTKDPRIGTVEQSFLQKHDVDAMGHPEYEGVDIKGKPFLKKMAQAYLKRYKLDPKLARYFSHKELKNLRDEQLFTQDGGEVDVPMLTPLKTPEGREEFIKNAKDRWWKQSMAAAAEGSEGHAGEAQPRFGLDESKNFKKERKIKMKFHTKWKQFLKESKSSAVGGDTLGQFIVDHGDGDAQQALNHAEEALEYLADEIATMREMREALNDLIADENRQEINDMMDEEDEEIQFAKDNPQYTTRTFDDEEEEIEFSEKWNGGEDVDDPWETEL